MLNIEALATKISAYGIVTPVFLNMLPPDPDQCVVVTEFPGNQMQLQNAVDVPSVQIICRSAQLDNKTARDLSHQVDSFFLDDTILPYDLDGSHVLTAGRLGGGPGYFATDEENRITYVCNYWIQIER